MDRWTDGQMDRWTDASGDGRIKGKTDIKTYREMDKRTDIFTQTKYAIECFLYR